MRLKYFEEAFYGSFQGLRSDQGFGTKYVPKITYQDYGEVETKRIVMNFSKLYVLNV